MFDLIKESIRRFGKNFYLIKILYYPRLIKEWQLYEFYSLIKVELPPEQLPIFNKKH